MSQLLFLNKLGQVSSAFIYESILIQLQTNVKCDNTLFKIVFQLSKVTVACFENFAIARAYFLFCNFRQMFMATISYIS